jgi:hypothetical protein
MAGSSSVQARFPQARTSPAAREAAQQEDALAKARNSTGLVCTRLEAHSDAMQQVTHDGEYLGRIRLAGGQPARSVGSPSRSAGSRTAGSYHNPKAAAKAPARAAGKTV